MKLNDKIRRATAALCLVALSACTQPAGRRDTPRSATPEADLTEIFPVFTAADALVKKWRHIKVWSQSDWKLVVLDGEIAIQPVVDTSSTALTRWSKFDTDKCPVAEWSWRVDALPDGADLASKKAEDMAASVMFVFGDPGSFTTPNLVPTLRYVWSSGKEAVGTVVKSPYFPDKLRSVVVRSGPAAGSWITERRNLARDYRKAFGAPPPGPVEVFALYTDNDHMGRPVKAWYRWARMLCSELPEPDSIL